jgi:hypothetical protein
MFESTFDHARELNEQYMKSARQAGNLYLESYEWAVDRTFDVEHRLADLTQQEWLKDMIKAQTGFARELTTSYTTAVRSILQ